MDVDDILAKQVEQLEKEKKELQEKLKSQEKKVNNDNRIFLWNRLRVLMVNITTLCFLSCW